MSIKKNIVVVCFTKWFLKCKSKQSVIIPNSMCVGIFWIGYKLFHLIKSSPYVIHLKKQRVKLSNELRKYIGSLNTDVLLKGSSNLSVDENFEMTCAVLDYLEGSGRFP